MTLYYEDTHVTIYCGDCRDIAPSLGKFDLLMTDPPYGIGEDGKRSAAKVTNSPRWKARRPKDYYGEVAWDNAPVCNSTLELVRALCEKQVIWGGNHYSLPTQRGWLVWDKETDGKVGSDCELAWTNVLGSTKRIRHLWDGFRKKHNEKRSHPTQKPLEVILWAILQAGESKTVFDPFAGSGTTGIAAKQLGKKATLIEREEQYCEMAAERLRQGVLSF